MAPTYEMPGLSRALALDLHFLFFFFGVGVMCNIWLDYGVGLFAGASGDEQHSTASTASI